MSLFSELKRRNVFKVAIAYIALGWVVVQATDIIVPALNLPDVLNTIVVYIGLVGFPFAIFFAWAFELTPDGVVRAEDVKEDHSITHSTGRKIDFIIIGLMAFAIGFLVYDRGSGPGEVIIADTSLENTIAVMPFADMSAEGDQEYFGDGIAEEILNVLASIEELDVTSRTSSFAFKDKDLLTPAIAEQLGVNYILEGSIRSAGNRVRVTAQLIDVTADSHMWSETFDRDLTDIFAIQDEISRSIAEAMRIELVGGEVLKEASTTNMDAYQLYLKAHQLFLNRNVPKLLEAIELLEQAVDLDPEFAEAWAELAVSRIVLPNLGRKENTDILTVQAMEEANKALSLDPDNAQGWAAKSAVHFERMEWEESFSSLKHAIELNPNNETAWLWLADDYTVNGYFEEANEYYLRAIELAPDLAMNHQLYAGNLFKQNKLDQARAEHQKTISLGGGGENINGALLALWEGDKKEFIDNFNIYTRSLNELPSPNLEQYVNAYYDPSLREGLKPLLQKDIDENNIISDMAIFLMLDGESYVYFIENKANTRTILLRPLYTPPFRPMLNQPAVKDYLKRIGLVDYWHKNGFADICRPVGDDDYECQDGQGNYP